jgi:hypothetical protein
MFLGKVLRFVIRMFCSSFWLNWMVSWSGNWYWFVKFGSVWNRVCQDSACSGK